MIILRREGEAEGEAPGQKTRGEDPAFNIHLGHRFLEAGPPQSNPAPPLFHEHRFAAAPGAHPVHENRRIGRVGVNRHFGSPAPYARQHQGEEHRRRRDEQPGRRHVHPGMNSENRCKVNGGALRAFIIGASDAAFRFPFSIDR